MWLALSVVLSFVQQIDTQGFQKDLHWVSGKIIVISFGSWRGWMRNKVQVEIMLTQECNLRCPYCVVDMGSNSKKGYNDLERISVFLNDLYESYKEGFNDYQFVIKLFGGEPMLNKDLLLGSVSLIREFFKSKGSGEYGYLMVIITNGTQFHRYSDGEIMEFYNSQDISVAVSFDCVREVTDTTRVTPSGEGTFDMVLNNIKRIRSLIKKPVRIQMVTSMAWAENIKKCLEFLKGNDDLIMPYFLPYTVTGEGEYIDFDTYHSAVKELSYYYLDNFHKNQIFAEHIFLNPIRKSLYFIDKEATGNCSLGDRYICMDIDGKTYPCSTLMNNVKGHGMKKPFNKENGQYYRTANKIKNREVCNGCDIRNYCSYQCLAVNLKNGHNFEYCKVLRAYIMEAIEVREKLVLDPVYQKALKV